MNGTANVRGTRGWNGSAFFSLNQWSMYLRQLIGFFIKVSEDHRMGPHHVALYVALFQQWCMNNGQSPVSISQAHLRQVAKIGRTTYHKCIRELDMYGYIRYTPSYSPLIGSFVYMIDMNKLASSADIR